MAGQRFQTPKGTRDWFPDDMAIRRHIESVWRTVSINHGFDEVDGPTFEHLDLYRVKSGDEIVSQLFSFRRAGGDTDYALRPEFTPTLARMVAERGPSLSMPVRWFSMPSMFRAERPQRGRLREHIQYNADILGTDELVVDADLIAVAVGVLEQFGLRPEQVKIKLSHRSAVRRILEHLGVDEPNMQAAFQLLDRRDKMDEPTFGAKALQIGLDADGVIRLNDAARLTAPLGNESELAHTVGVPLGTFEELAAIRDALGGGDLADWCEYDLGIVRGLAYYTGTVFEVHETTGRERAIAGGGRYDQLVELFGGSPTPAVGYAMGDVVIRLVLQDHGLLPEPAACRPRPDLFVVAASDTGAASLRELVVRWRRDGLHVRQSYRSTRNVGKLLREASRDNARFAVILGDDTARGQVELKDLDGGDQETLATEDVVARIRSARGSRCDS